jgi:hypothetical protein
VLWENHRRLGALILVTNFRLYLAIGIPLVFNAAWVAVVVGLLNAKMAAKFSAVDARFDAMDQRFDDMRDLWRAQLHRVEEVLDARLKHLESR